MADEKKDEVGGRGAGQKGRPKHRSPNYPAVGLRKAVERADELYREFKRYWAPIGVVQEKRWGYKPNSGAGNQVVAALKSYGLIDVQGDGDQRQVKLSDAGYRIVENHKDRPDLLKQAATGPSLHAELWKKYGADGLPPDDIIRYYLKFDRNFNPESVDSFIAQFRDTINFSGLNSSDKITGDVRRDDDDDDGDDPGDEMIATAEQDVKERGRRDAGGGGDTNKRRTPMADEWEGPTVELDLPRGNRIQIRLRSKVTPAEFEKIKRIYDLSELSFVDANEPENG